MTVENTYFLLLNLIQIPLVLALLKLSGFSLKKGEANFVKPIIIVFSIAFIVDLIFTQTEWWFYSSTYNLGIKVFGVPIEKLIQTLSLSTSTLLIYNLVTKKLNYLFKKWIIRLLIFLILPLSLPMTYIHWYDWHTLLASLVFNFSLLYLFIFIPKWTSNFFITFWTFGIPYVFLQLVLSGYFFGNTLFEYNTLETQGFFVVYFPVEELMYWFGFSLLGVYLYEVGLEKNSGDK